MVEEKVIIKVSADTSEFKKGMKDASESAKDVKKTTDKTGSVAGDSISKASDNLSKSGDKLKGGFKGLGAKFSGLGERITTSLGKAVPGFDKITEKLKGAGKAGKLAFAAIAATAIAAIAAIGVKLTKMAVDISGKFVKAFNPARFDAQMGKMRKSAEKLKTTLGVFLEPVFTALTNGLSWIMDKLTAFLEGILSAVGFIGGLLGVMDGVACTMDDMADSMDEASMAADQGLASFDKLTTLGEITGDAEQAERLNTIMADSARKAQELKRGLGGMLKDIPGLIASSFRGVVASVASSVSSLGGRIKDLFNGPVMDGLESARTAVLSWASNAKETLNGVWNAIGDGARALWADVTEFAGMAWEAISSAGSSAWSAISSAGQSTWDTISSAGESAWNTLSSVGGEAWDTISALGTSAWDTISSAGRGMWNNLSSTVGGFWETVSSAGASTWDTISSVGSSVWADLSSSAGGFWSNVTELGGGAWESVKSAAINAWTNIGTTASGVFGGIRDILADTFAEPLKNISDSFGRLWGGFRSSAENALSGLAGWVEDKFKKVIDAILAPVRWVIDKIGNLSFNLPSTSGGSIVDTIVGAFSGLKFWADGGVAEPNNPFLAVLGDNRSEREVVTPVSLMKATMREVMMEMGTEGNDRPINLDINLDGRRIARATYDYMEMERRRRGA